MDGLGRADECPPPKWSSQAALKRRTGPGSRVSSRWAGCCPLPALTIADRSSWRGRGVDRRGSRANRSGKHVTQPGESQDERSSRPASGSGRAGQGRAD